MAYYNEPCHVFDPANYYNPLRWYSISGTLVMPAELSTIGTWPIPQCCDNADAPSPHSPLLNSNIWQRAWGGEYAGPVFLPGETYQITGNLNTPVTANANIDLALIDQYGKVIDRVITGATPTWYTAPEGDSRWYSNYLIDEGNATYTGIYYYILFDSTTNNCLYLSNPMWIYLSGDVQEAFAKTILLEYYDANDYYKFDYKTEPNIANKFRLHIGQTETTYEDDTTIYREATTGRRERYAGKIDRKLTFMTEHADQFFLEAIAVALSHSTVKINEKEVTLAEAPTIETQLRRDRHRMNFSVYDTEFAEVNYGC